MRPRRWIRNLQPAYFALVMATSIVAIGCDVENLARIAKVLTGLNPGAFVLLVALTLARLVAFRDEVWADITSHARAPGFLTIPAGSSDDLTRFIVALKRDHKLGANTVLHNAVIVAQFLKRHGRNGITRELQLPERITSLPKEYREEELGRFFEACYDLERVLFSTFLLTGFREQEVMYLFWSDINPELRTVRVTAKPELGFYPKRWEERQIPAPAELLAELQKHSKRPNCQFVFPSPTGNREQHMLDRCKAVAKRAGLDPTRFDLKTFRSTYATRMLRQGFDVRTVQHWMGHKSLETTMRYLVPASDVHSKLDQVKIPALPGSTTPRKAPTRETGPRRRGRPAKPRADMEGSTSDVAANTGL